MWFPGNHRIRADERRVLLVGVDGQGWAKTLGAGEIPGEACRGTDTESCLIRQENQGPAFSQSHTSSSQRMLFSQLPISQCSIQWFKE